MVEVERYLDIVRYSVRILELFHMLVLIISAYKNIRIVLHIRIFLI